MIDEAQVISIVLRNPNLIHDVDLIADEFSLHLHKIVWSGLIDLVNAKRPVDTLSLAQHISETTGRELLGEIGDIHQLAAVPKNLKGHIARVKEVYRDTQAKEIASQLLNNRKNDNKDLDLAIRSLMALNRNVTSFDRSMTDCLTQATNLLEKAHSGEKLGLRTNLIDYDKVLGGLNKSDLIVIGARPAMGKTALMLNIATRSDEIKAGIFSGEQPAEQVGTRMISIHGNVNGARMRVGECDNEDWTNITVATGQLMSKQHRVFDKPGISIGDIERTTRFWVQEYGINAIFVDYIQKINHEDRRLSTLDKIADIAIRLKDLAKELNIPVIALAQVKRDVDTRNNKRPYQSDIKECGVIEQEADQIITLYRDEVYDMNTQDRGIAELCVCKNRHGPTGTIKTQWQAKYMQFNNLATQQVKLD